MADAQHAGGDPAAPGTGDNRLIELLVSTEVAARFGVSRSRVDQLVADGSISPPFARSGRQRLWRASDIELDLAARGQVTDRPPPPRFDRIPVPTVPLPLILDTVLKVPLHPGGEPPRIHLRIWRGRVGGQHRTVLVLGAVRESHLVLKTHAEAIAEAVAAQHLGAEAREAWWFCLWPRGTFGPNARIDFQSFAVPPRGPGGLLELIQRRGARAAWQGAFTAPLWRTVDADALTAAVGAEVDVAYPPHTYTAAVVTRAAGGERPVVLEEFDPDDLRSGLARLEVLHSYASALLRYEIEPKLRAERWPAWELLGTTSAQDAARGAEALRIAVRVLAPPVLETDANYATAAEATDPGAVLVERRWWRPDAAGRHLLEQAARPLTAFATRAGEPYADLTAAAVHRALGWLRGVHRELAAAADAHEDPRLQEAVAAAVPQLAAVRHALDPMLIDDPGPEMVTVRAFGAAEQAYVDKVAWFGPKPGDERRAAELRDYLWSDDRSPGLPKLGYDPFGRLVWHNPDTGALAVERPRALPAQPLPPEAKLLATPGAGALFVQLPDGRVAVAPADPRFPDPDLAWGGRAHVGPEGLLRQLVFIAAEHPDPDRPRALQELPPAAQSALAGELTDRPGDQALRLPLGRLREAVRVAESKDGDRPPRGTMPECGTPDQAEQRARELLEAVRPPGYATSVSPSAMADGYIEEAALVPLRCYLFAAAQVSADRRQLTAWADALAVEEVIQVLEAADLTLPAAWRRGLETVRLGSAQEQERLRQKLLHALHQDGKPAAGHPPE